MTAPFRLPAGGHVDRATPLTFTFNGHAYEGLQGDTLASALLANGVRNVARSIRFGRARGVISAGVEEPSALVSVSGAINEPITTAPAIELLEGLTANGLVGRGRLSVESDPSIHDKSHRHCDVVVVGAGPTGLAAALAAGERGARVVLIDEGSAAGGSLLTATETLDGAPATAWLREAHQRLGLMSNVLQLSRTTAVGRYDDNYIVALQRRIDHPSAGVGPATTHQRLWHLRTRRTVLATGAHERLVAFADNDRPGVMLAGAARTYVNRYAVSPGRRAVVFTTNDSAYATALDLARAGVEVVALLDARDQPPPALVRHCADAGIEVLTSHVVVSTTVGGDGTLAGIHAARLTNDRGTRDGLGEIACDLLAVSGGWNPVLDLYLQAQGQVRYDHQLAAFVPGVELRGVDVAGAARGLTTLDDCLRDGAGKGLRAATLSGFDGQAQLRLPATEPAHDGAPPRPLWLVPHPGKGEPWADHFIDLARDATVADIHRAVGAGMRSVEHIKRYTTIGTGHDQGKTSSVLATAILAEAIDMTPDQVGMPTRRPPYTPVSFAALAGRDRGRLHDPIRVTSLHPWHVANNAVFEDVGQWKRPRYFPRRGEDMDAAVLRECRAARTNVAMMDASTLGKIDVHGPDAATFLDRVYTNLMSSLAVGAIRYGVMCRADGMVFDDGTAIRLAEDRYLVTTTTGNAATVLDWFEEWLQTEWPDLRVRFTSVTDHWATIALVGPRARAVLGAVTPPDLAVGADDFPFMAWRNTHVANVEARVCRISFSGELAYEINVCAWHALAVWEALSLAGAQWGITPYGTETMHVLRAEKGYPIIGQDTDGTVTPQDLGMSWIVSKKKDDFIGMRSFARPDTARADRKHLIGLLPVDPDLLLPEGAQLVADQPLQTPVPMLGHVTSSYRSAALERTFALALVKGGRDRLGDRVLASFGGRTVAVTIVDPVFYDREGARRDG